jgi:predicted transcriptional regulator
MRSRERILSNLEQIYRESFDHARKGENTARMIDLDNSYVRDQLMLEILLDIRDLFAVTPAAPAASGKSAIEQLQMLRKLTGR